MKKLKFLKTTTNSRNYKIIRKEFKNKHNSFDFDYYYYKLGNHNKKSWKIYRKTQYYVNKR